MPVFLGPVLPILAAALLLQCGNGLLATLLGVRLHAAGFAASVAGLVAMAYFAGQLIGSGLSGGVINRVGHIRAFATFAAVLSASALVFAMDTDPVVWSVARFVGGFAMAGVLLAMESWLNHVCGNATRGRTLSVYMAVTYAACGLGPALMTLADPAGFALFSVAAMVLALSLVPMSLSTRAQPGVTEPSRLRFRDLFRVSPLGMVGAVLSGAMIGPVMGLTAVFAVSEGYGPSGAAALWFALIGGGFVLSIPLGRLSDRIERRLVLAGVCLAAAVLTAAMSLIGVRSLEMLLGFGAVLGGLVFSTYSLCAAHTNDLVGPENSVPAAAGLLIAFGIGAVVGPPVAAGAMDLFGPWALFQTVAGTCAMLGVFALHRRRVGADVGEDDKTSFVPLPQTSTAAYELDPWDAGAEVADPGESA